MKSRVDELKNQSNNENGGSESSTKFVSIPDDINNSSADEEGSTKTVTKLFMNEFHEDTVDEALHYVVKLCPTPPNLILAYAPTSKIQNNRFVWAEEMCAAKAKANFKLLWEKLRVAKKEGKIAQLGICDIDLDTIKEIFGDEYDFTILQINISTCCVVPPELTAFCKEKDIQLLTHSDPQVILPTCHLSEIDNNLVDYKVKWIARYVETLVCRGIIKKKGFIVNFRKIEN